jgi:DNA-binding response OmpR family regulator
LVINDDSDLRASVGRLLRSIGLDVQLFASISDFLKSNPPDGPTCLVLDVRLPGQSGLDLQRELAAAKRELPIILHAAGDANYFGILSGNRGMKPSRLGMRTLGRVPASMVSFGSMSLFCARI